MREKASACRDPSSRGPRHPRCGTIPDTSAQGRVISDAGLRLPCAVRADYKRTCRAHFNDVPQRRLPNSGKIGITNTAKKFCRGPSQSAASFQSSSCRFRLLSSTGQRVGGILLGGEQDEGVGPHHLARWNPSLSGAAAARHRRVSARDRASGRGFAVVMAPSPYCCPCAYFIRSRILVITDPNAHRNKIEI
jgi:hypothetical protein